MTWVTLLGALLMIAGVVWMAAAAILRGRMSDARHNPEDTVFTLEPRHRGLRFLGIGTNWPGLALAIAGGLLLLLPLAT